MSVLAPRVSGTEAVKAPALSEAVTLFTVTLTGSAPVTVPVTVAGEVVRTAPFAGLVMAIVIWPRFAVSLPGSAPRIDCQLVFPQFPARRKR